MSIAGALVFLMGRSTVAFPGATLNIYTQVGLVTLMGLISKHGILIVEVANELQAAGKSRREAIEEAAAIRLRPILMTTAAMVLGVVPLIVATGAGALSRFSMGLVIASGLSVGTLFTLFVVPAVYLMLAADHSKSSPTRRLPTDPAVRIAVAMNRARDCARCEITFSLDSRCSISIPVGWRGAHVVTDLQERARALAGQ